MNLADVVTEKDIPLTDSLQVTLFTGRLHLGYKDSEQSKDVVKIYS